jgi:hypothetical protein
MGREAKRKKQARRDGRRYTHETHEFPGLTMHAVSTASEVMAALYGLGPVSDDWRQDVLGQPLSLRLGPDGALMINGHPLTREMSAALQAERPDEPAENLDYDYLMDMGRQMFPGLEMRRNAPK